MFLPGSGHLAGAFVFGKRARLWFNILALSGISIREVGNKKSLREFVFLPEALPHPPPWVPPIYSDDLGLFDPKRNLAFRYCTVRLLLACRNGRPVGRVVGIINHRANSFRNENIARFGFLEAGDDPEITEALLSEIEGWAKSQGADALVGPMGFSDQDPQGMLVEGFDTPPLIATNYNSPEMPRILEGMGYTKKVDYACFRVDIPDEMPESHRRIAERVKRDFRLLEFKRKRDLRPFIRPVLSLMNETYASLHGFAPLDPEEMDQLARRYMSFLEPDLIKGVEKDGQVVGFFIAMPDISPGIKRARGRLFPFGFLHILKELRSSKDLVLLLVGIRKDMQARGIDALMAISLYESARRRGMKRAFFHQELEDNRLVLAETLRVGAVPYKRARIYQKSL